MPSTEKLDTHHKALTLNLDPSTFGSFAEIGANCNATGDHDYPLLPWGNVCLPVESVLWLLDERKFRCTQKGPDTKSGGTPSMGNLVTWNLTLIEV